VSGRFPELPRRIGAWTAASLLISNVIGAGIFTTPGFLARDLGHPGLILAIWILGASAALAGALAYSELGAALPLPGGEYVYLRHAYGPLIGFLSGWASLTVGFSAGIAASAVSFATYVREIAPSPLAIYLPEKVLALWLLWSVTAVHLTGPDRGGLLQRSLAWLNIGAILTLLLGAFTIGEGSWTHLTARPTSWPGFGAIVVSFIFVSYAYSGWNASAYLAGEIVDPGRALPWSMLWGTLLVALLYVGLNVAYIYALPVETLAQEPVLPVAKKAAAALFGSRSAAIISAILCLSMAGAVSAMVWAGPRVYFAMAADGLFPPWLGKVSSGARFPHSATILQGLWSSLLILSGTFERLVMYSGVILIIFNALGVAAVLVLRRRRPELTRPYRVPLYPWLPGFYILLALVVTMYSIWERPVTSGLGLATVAAGVPLYLIWRRQRPKADA
jgi:APA family basic amino acid/polyamine antiporter